MLIRHVVALLAAALPAYAKSPNSLGKELLSAVLADDVLAAASIFAQSEPAEANRLANAMDWRGKSVLMHAASRDFPKIVKLLLQNKARPDASDYSAGGVTALMLAARNGSVAAAEALVAGGASVHATTPAGTSRGAGESSEPKVKSKISFHIRRVPAVAYQSQPEVAALHKWVRRYRLCWCAGSDHGGAYRCSAAEDFRVDFGMLSLIGPLQGHRATCVAGQLCTVKALRAVGDVLRDVPPWAGFCSLALVA